MNIDVDGVHVTLSGTDVLHAVDASVEPGHLVGLVGPNGAGKTTLLRTITAAIDPDEGSVFVGDEDVHALLSRAASRRLASVPQQTNLDFEFTVREVVEMGRHPHRGRFGSTATADDEAVVDNALERAQMHEMADRPVTTLSGGERQRVLLARALAQDAPVLVLDEPTASLDVHHQVRTLGLVRDLVDEGRTGIAAIHDLDLAARYCDSLVLLADGEVRAAGAPAEVLTADRIRDAFGATAVVTRDPVARTPCVTVRDATVAESLDAAIHVFGGTSEAAPYLPALTDVADHVTVGPVVDGGQDHAVATGLGLSVTPVAPYRRPNEDERAAIRSHLERADVVVLPSGVAALQVVRELGDAAPRVVEPGEGTEPRELLGAIAEVLDRAPALQDIPVR